MIANLYVEDVKKARFMIINLWLSYENMYVILFGNKMNSEVIRCFY